MDTAGLTLYDIAIRVAQALGVQSVNPDGSIGLPDDVTLVDRITSCVRDGVDDMRLSAPTWYCLRQQIIIPTDTAGTSPLNIDGDSTRYALPWNAFGSMASEWAWILEGSQRTNRIILSEPLAIEQLNAANITGAPRRGCILPQKTPGMWELRIAPAPDAIYNLISNVSLLAYRMNQLTDRSPFGQIHDSTVVAAAKYCFIRDDHTDPRFERYQAEYARLLAMSMALDLKIGTPKTLGRLTDSGMTPLFGGSPTRLNGGVTSFNGTTINP